MGHRTGADYRKRFRVGVEFTSWDQGGQSTRRIEYAVSGKARVTPRCTVDVGAIPLDLKRRQCRDDIRQMPPLVGDVAVPHRAARHMQPEPCPGCTQLSVIDTPVGQVRVVLQREHGGHARSYLDPLQIRRRHRAGPDQGAGHDLTLL